VTIRGCTAGVFNQVTPRQLNLAIPLLVDTVNTSDALASAKQEMTSPLQQ